MAALCALCVLLSAIAARPIGQSRPALRRDAAATRLQLPGAARAALPEVLPRSGAGQAFQKSRASGHFESAAAGWGRRKAWSLFGQFVF